MWTYRLACVVAVDLRRDKTRQSSQPQAIRSIPLEPDVTEMTLAFRPPRSLVHPLFSNCERGNH